MRNIYNITGAELEVMEKLWDLNECVKQSHLLTIFQEDGKEWKRQTLNTFLSRLEEKGLVKRENRMVEAVYGREQYNYMQMNEAINHMYDGKLGNFVAAFTKASRAAGQDADAIGSERRNPDGSIVKLVDVCRQYGEGANVVNALYHVNARINKGEFVAVVGASGSGKSTFLNMCGGLDKPTSGDIYVEGVDIGKLASDKLTEFRRKRIGFIFQNYNLISVMSVYENIVLPVQMGGNLEDSELFDRIMDALGLTGLEHRLPSELSGGQQQRVAIARALISTPAIILADEPTGNLDSSSAEDVMDLLKRAVRDFGQTVIMITHNEALTGECDRILHMKDGRLEER